MELMKKKKNSSVGFLQFVLEEVGQQTLGDSVSQLRVGGVTFLVFIFDETLGLDSKSKRVRARTGALAILQVPAVRPNARRLFVGKVKLAVIKTVRAEGEHPLKVFHGRVPRVLYVVLIRVKIPKHFQNLVYILGVFLTHALKLLLVFIFSSDPDIGSLEL